MSRIRFKTHAGETDIYIPGKIEMLDELVPKDSTIILADENVLNFHHAKISSFPVISIPEGEKSKSMNTYDEVFQQLLDHGVDRSWNLVGIGGGITTDLAGFVASTYFRGIPFGYVSTTLLGQVDAAIGGKNGINYKGFKNFIGVIKQPDFVICDTESLKTLTKTEFIGGFSEIIKYAFIKRGDLYSFLSNNLDKAIEFDMPVLEYIVEESVKTKMEIVSSDEFEKGDRKLLNFGHTFGHALEKIYKVSHGEAVAIGMVLASRMSANLGLVNSDIPLKLEDLLILAGLPVSMEFDTDLMAETMKKDKKRRKQCMEFILLEDIGKAVIKEISLNDISSVLNDLH